MNDLEKGMVIVLDGTPYEVLSVTHTHLGRGGSTVEAKLRNLRNETVIYKNFKQADTIEEAEIEKIKYQFIYQHRGIFWFANCENPKERISLEEKIIGEKAKFLKPNTIVEATKFKNEIISIKLPIKVDLKVIEAPPGVKGDTAQGGSKIVKLETGAEISVPLFIKEGDIIRVNTETGEYVERV
jgi:elongation factor P